MPVRISSDHVRSGNALGGPQRFLVVLAFVGALASTILVLALPAPLVLPTLSVLIILSAGIAGLSAWVQRHPRRSGRISYWDIAGALTLIGVFAALLSDPELAIPLFESRSSD